MKSVIDGVEFAKTGLRLNQENQSKKGQIVKTDLSSFQRIFYKKAKQSLGSKLVILYHLFLDSCLHESNVPQK